MREVECGVCGLRQPVSQTCINTECGTCFGEYFCRICNFFDDDLSKEPFHCDGCGICRCSCPFLMLLRYVDYAVFAQAGFLAGKGGMLYLRRRLMASLPDSLTYLCRASWHLCPAAWRWQYNLAPLRCPKVRDEEKPELESY